MTIPFGAGDTPPADALNGLLLQRSVILTADHPGVVSSTTRVDTNLSIAVEASKTYEFEAVLFYSAATAGDFAAGLSTPTGTTGRLWPIATISSDNDTFGEMYIGSTTDLVNTGAWAAPGQTTASDVVSMALRGYLKTSTTAGSVTFRYSQLVSNGTATILRAGSRMTIREATPV